MQSFQVLARIRDVFSKQALLHILGYGHLNKGRIRLCTTGNVKRGGETFDFFILR
jgi:hypothetical protein